jgi:predicted Zn-dependent peptidase
MRFPILSLIAALTFAASAYSAELRIPIDRYKLSNGMRVVLSQDNTAPVVAVYLIYGVGARSEEKGRTGFAHLFEHMMFQGSKNVPKGTHFKTVESNGGYLNGSTHADYTDYFEVLPSNKLAVALWLESDRMRSLAITDENLTNQKEAVKQEKRMRMDNQPYAPAIVDEYPALVYRNWANSHSIIGSFDDLNAATVADVAKFFKTHYAPNNAVLAIAGDIKIAETKKLVESYFGDIPSQPQAPGPDLKEPEQTEPRYLKVADRLARLPMILLGWPGPVRRSPDYYAMVMLDVVLTGGDSSRFAQNLVKGRQSVLGVEANLGWPFGSATDYKDPNVYGIAVNYKPNFTAKQILEQVEEEIQKVQKDGVPAPELERARTFLRAARVKSLQTTISRATHLGQYELLDNNPELINTEIDDMLKVTGPQIQAAAKKYLQPAKRSLIDIEPKPEGKPSPEGK